MAHRSIRCALLRPLALLGALASLSVTKPLFAQVLGNSGDAVFGAERLFGVRHERLELENSSVAKATTISFGTSERLLPHNSARLGFDYLAARKFSVGGALGFSSGNGEGPVPVAEVHGQTFLLVGRVGFLHMFGHVFGFWPRGGLTYRSTSLENGSDWSDFGLNLEIMFPIAIAPHFGFLTGLSFDHAFTGSYDPPTGPERDLHLQSISWQFGLFGWI